MILLQFLQTLSFETFTIFVSTLIVLFVYPVLIIFYSLCWVYRCSVVYFVQKNPKFGNILKGIDAILAGQNPYSNPECVLLPCFYLIDKLDVHKVVDGLTKNVIAQGLYPELKQKLVRKYGYYFWYNIEDFKVEDHVRNLNTECPNMPVTRAQLINLANEKLVKLPFDPERPPWEFIVVSNYIDDSNPALKSVLMLRVNHCLMDGYSIYNFMMKLAAKPWKSLLMQKHENPCLATRLIDICNFIMLIFLGPYHFLKMFVFCNDDHEFVKNVFKPDFKDVWKTESTSAVSKDRLRALRNSCGVSMSTLITTLFAQAVYKTMKRCQTNKLSKTIHAFLSFPLPGHQDMLTNHWTLVKIPIQVNEEDPLQTLKFVEKQFQHLRSSVKPLVAFYFNKMLAFAPLGLRYSQNKLPPTTFVLTNFPGPMEPADTFGCRCKLITLTGTSPGGTAYRMASNSICDDFWFDVISPICNSPTQESLALLSKDVIETLNNLESRSLEGTKKINKKLKLK